MLTVNSFDVRNYPNDHWFKKLHNVQQLHSYYGHTGKVGPETQDPGSGTPRWDLGPHKWDPGLMTPI